MSVYTQQLKKLSVETSWDNNGETLNDQPSIAQNLKSSGMIEPVNRLGISEHSDLRQHQ